MQEISAVDKRESRIAVALFVTEKAQTAPPPAAFPKAPIPCPDLKWKHKPRGYSRREVAIAPCAFFFNP